jgi:hypothetical protein
MASLSTHDLRSATPHRNGSVSGRDAAIGRGDYLRAGKLATLRAFCRDVAATHVVLNFAATGANLSRVAAALSADAAVATGGPRDGGQGGVVVQDRTALVLEIFAKHATTAEARLQVRLAGALTSRLAELAAMQSVLCPCIISQMCPCQLESMAGLRAELQTLAKRLARRSDSDAPRCLVVLTLTTCTDALVPLSCRAADARDAPRAPARRAGAASLWRRGRRVGDRVGARPGCAERRGRRQRRGRRRRRDRGRAAALRHRG